MKNPGSFSLGRTLGPSWASRACASSVVTPGGSAPSILELLDGGTNTPTVVRVDTVNVESRKSGSKLFRGSGARMLRLRFSGDKLVQPNEGPAEGST